jgi:hypothetical protein
MALIASAEGVGVQLADDLPGTGSKIRDLGCIRDTAFAGFAAASRQIVSKLDSYALRAGAFRLQQVR